MRSELTPHRGAIRPGSIHCFEETNHDLQILLRHCRKKPSRFRLHSFVQGSQLAQARGHKRDQNASPIIRVVLATDITSFLQSIKRDCYSSAAKPNPEPELAGCCRPVQLQHVNHLHVGETQTDLFRGPCIKEDHSCNEFPDFEHDPVCSADRRSHRNGVCVPDGGTLARFFTRRPSQSCPGSKYAKVSMYLIL
jgi:hypothetical protein